MQDILTLGSSSDGRPKNEVVLHWFNIYSINGGPKCVIYKWHSIL